MKTLNRLLIANRGEIAVRIARTARRMGIATIAICSDADRLSPHVRACDEQVPIGGTLPADSYLVIAKILAAARASGAEAIHPGYGFLSENAAFAAAVADAGLIFVGPPAEPIEAMGDKAARAHPHGRRRCAGRARLRRRGAGPRAADREAERIGFPLMVKASAGGGGRGMRRVERGRGPARGRSRARASRRKTAFGDGRSDPRARRASSRATSRSRCSPMRTAA